MRMYPRLLANAVRSALRSKHDLVLENLAVGHENSIRPRSHAEPASSDRSDLVLPSHGLRHPPPRCNVDAPPQRVIERAVKPE